MMYKVKNSCLLVTSNMFNKLIDYKEFFKTNAFEL